MKGYSGMTKKGEGRSQEIAEIVGDEVTLHATNETGFTVRFDKQPTRVMQNHETYFLIVIASYNNTDHEK